MAELGLGPTEGDYPNVGSIAQALTIPVQTEPGQPRTVFVPGGYTPRMPQESEGFLNYVIGIPNDIAEGVAAAGTQISSAWLADTPLGSMSQELVDNISFGPGSAAAFASSEELYNALTPEERTRVQDFYGATSLRDVEKIRRERQVEDEIRQEMGDGPLPEMLAGFIAQFGEPTNYIGLGALKKGGEASLSAMRAALLGGTRVAGTAGGIALAQELAMHQLQQTRTLGDTIATVGLTMAFGGVVGQWAGRVQARSAKANMAADDILAANGFSPRSAVPPEENIVGLHKQFADAVDEVNALPPQTVPEEVPMRQDGDTLKAVEPHTPDAPMTQRAEGGGAVGAAVTPAYTSPIGNTNTRFNPDDTKLTSSLGVGEWLARNLSKIHLAPPSLEVMASSLNTAREYMLRLVDTGLDIIGTTEGRVVMSGAPVSSRISSRMRTEQVMDQRSFNAAYTDHLVEAKARGEKPLSRLRFSREVARAVRRGDIDPNNPMNPLKSASITKAAKYKFDTLSRYYDELHAAGLIDPNIPRSHAIGYLHRMYDRRRIMQHRGEFHDIVRAHIMTLRLPASQGGGLMHHAYSAVEIDEIVINTTNAILRIGAKDTGGIPSYTIGATRGPMQNRTLNIDDAILDSHVTKSGERISFLIDDVQQVQGRYFQNVIADLELTREFGSPDAINEITTNILSEAARKADAMEKSGNYTPEQLEAVTAEAARVKQTLEDLWNNIRGTKVEAHNTGGGRVLRQLRNFQFIRLLGMAGVGSIPDLAKNVFEEGLKRTYGRAYAELFSGFQGLKLNRKDLEEFANGIDVELAATTQALTDTGVNLPNATLFERVMDNASALFGTLNGMNHFNAFGKRFAANLALHRVLEVSEKFARGDPISDLDRARMARSGFSEADMLAIAAERMQGQHQFSATGGATPTSGGWYEVDGHKVSALSTWGNQDLADRVGRAIFQQAENVITTPGFQDAASWTHGPLGATVVQFKKFNMAVIQRTMVRGIQRRDAETMTSIALATALGGLSFYARSLIAGKQDVVHSMGESEFLLNAIDRSGVAPLLFEADAILGSVGAPQPTVLLTGKEPRRVTERGFFGQFFGPSAGFASDVVATYNYAKQKEFDLSAGDISRMRRLLPFQNLIGFSLLVDQIQNGVAVSVDPEAP